MSPRGGRGKGGGRGKRGEDPAGDRRVEFLVAGVQKGGTTTLHALLAQHPQIAQPRLKELHFFDNDERDWANPNYPGYHRKFAWTETTTLAGESTPNYIYWPGALERIQAYHPGIRLVLSFRDPIERAFSQWCMVKDRGPRNPDFAEGIRAMRPTSWPKTAEEAGPRQWAFVGRGYYGEQLARVQELFPAEQVLLFDYHRLFEDLPGSVDRITDLIGVDRFEQLPTAERARPQPQTLDAPPPTEDDIGMLVDLYADDLAVFASRSGLDLSGWSTWRVVQGSLSVAELTASLVAKATFTKGDASTDSAPADQPELSTDQA